MCVFSTVKKTSVWWESNSKSDCENIFPILGTIFDEFLPL